TFLFGRRQHSSAPARCSSLSKEAASARPKGGNGHCSVCIFVCTGFNGRVQRCVWRGKSGSGKTKCRVAVCAAASRRNMRRDIGYVSATPTEGNYAGDVVSLIG